MSLNWFRATIKRDITGVGNLRVQCIAAPYNITLDSDFCGGANTNYTLEVILSHTYTHTHGRTPTHLHTHAHLRAHTYIHKHIRTHIHIQA